MRNWLHQAQRGAGFWQKPAAQAFSWLHQNVLDPAASVLQYVPVYGQVIQAARPLGQMVANQAKRIAEGQEPSFGFKDAVDAGRSIVGAANAYKMARVM